MKALAPRFDREALRKPAPPAALLVQRRSTLGGGSALGPPVAGGGRPLAGATRQEMERGFGRDFGHIRVHDDGCAHASAGALGAQAYAAGDHIVFGAGRYAPGTAAGRALLAHELAHTIQQRGMQMKASGPLPAAADARLEAEADAAAAAIAAGTAMPALSSAAGAAPLRKQASAGAGAAGAAAREIDVPEVGRVGIEEEQPPGSDHDALFIRAAMPPLAVPNKGGGKWVRESYESAALGGSLLYRAQAEGGKFNVVKDELGDYRTVWVNKAGFASLASLGTAIAEADKKTPLVSPNAKIVVEGLKQGSLEAAKCDVDHIVEKQLGGNNIPDNLQLLGRSTNRSAGARLGPRLATLAQRIRRHSRPKLTRIDLVFRGPVSFDAQTVSDPVYAASKEIEELVRLPGFGGDAGLRQAAGGAPVTLAAGGKSVEALVRPQGATTVEGPAKFLITGMHLDEYRRGGAKTDTVTADLAVPGLVPDRQQAQLNAEQAGSATGKPGSERRELRFAANRNHGLSALFPYLSPVSVTALDFQGGDLDGRGILRPTIPLIGPIDILFGPNRLEASRKIGLEKLRSPAHFFHFTGAELRLQLKPFVPSGRLDFTLGPAVRPVLKGFVDVRYGDGALIGEGRLEPARPIPGLSGASGQVGYHSRNGWSGRISVETDSYRAAIGFRQQGEKIIPYAQGRIGMRIRDVRFGVDASWDGGDLTYSGDATIPNPFPGVASVALKAVYRNGLLEAKGSAALNWPGLNPQVAISYRRSDGEAVGHFTGSATIAPKGGRLSGSCAVEFDDKGLASASGSLTYRITDQVQPSLAASVDKDRKLKLSGDVPVGDILLADSWPKTPKTYPIVTLSEEAEFPAGRAFTIFFRAEGSVKLHYGIRAIRLTDVRFAGSLYPLEADPAIEGKLAGRAAASGGAGMAGSIEVTAGTEALTGAAGAEAVLQFGAGVDFWLEPTLAGSLDYKDGFSFSIGIGFSSDIALNFGGYIALKVSSLWGRGPGKTWTAPIFEQRRLAKPLKIAVGRFGYAGGAATRPGPDPVAIPDPIDPSSMVRKILSEAFDL